MDVGMAACGTEFKERALTWGRKSGPQQISALQGRSAALPHGKKKNPWISLSQAIQPSVCLLELPLPSLQLYITHRHNFLLLAALVQGAWSSLMGRESSSDHSQRWDPPWAVPRIQELHSEADFTHFRHCWS